MMIKKWFNFTIFSKNSAPTEASKVEKEKLKEKVIEGAKKAVSEYKNVFVRLAEHDRT